MLGQALLKEIIGSSYIHVDKTGLKLLPGKESGKVKKIHEGYLWSYNSSIQKLVYFDYQPGRGEKHAIGILKNFRGIIQTDGWHVYEGFAAKLKELYKHVTWRMQGERFLNQKLPIRNWLNMR